MISEATFNELKEIGISTPQPDQVLYYYTNITGAISILNDRTLKFSDCTHFNDPFELNEQLISFNINDENKVHFVSDILSPINSDNKFENIIKLIPVDQLIKSHYEIFRESRSHMGIIPFTTKRDNPLMWSHYADKHKGVCIGFKLHGFIKKNYVVLNVKYEDKLIPRNLYNENVEFDFVSIYRWLLTKSRYWEYENEFRLLSEKYKGITPFPTEFQHSDFISEIYYGVSTAQQDISDIEKSLSDRKYKIIKKGKMRINKGTFDLTVDEFK